MLARHALLSRPPVAMVPVPHARVLVADDQPAVVDALRLLLKLHGYEVQAAASPAEALEALARSREPFDVLVMDLNYARDTTSGQEGLELVTRVHALDPDLPIVAMTAWSTVPLAVATMREGGCDFVEKPWNNARLLATVRAQVETGRRRRRARRLETDALAVQHRLLARSVPARRRVRRRRVLELRGAAGRRRVRASPPGGRQPGRGHRGRLREGHAGRAPRGQRAGHAGGPAGRGAASRRGVPAPRPRAPPRLGPDRFVSFVCAVLDPGRGTLRYANAGHPAPLLLRADGGLERLETGGPVLGIVADAAYEEAALPLRGRDRLVLFTDGVLEASPAAGGEELGEARLVAALRGLAGASAAGAAAAAVDAARSFAGGALVDDATVVVLDRLT